MKFDYTFEPISLSLRPQRIEEINKQIEKSMPLLENNIDRLIGYIKKENELENYIEINLPFFDSNLSYKINLYYGKLMISVMNQIDSEIFGHLLIKNYDCLNKNEIQKLGNLSTFDARNKRYRKLS